MIVVIVKILKRPFQVQNFLWKLVQDSILLVIINQYTTYFPSSRPLDCSETLLGVLRYSVIAVNLYRDSFFSGLDSREGWDRWDRWDGTRSRNLPSLIRRGR